MVETVAEMKGSVETDGDPPEGLGPELRALWYAKAGRWHEAHNIAQEIESEMGSWIHAHLHVIEGDLWNAGYWYRKAGKPESPPEETDAEWERIVAEALG